MTEYLELKVEVTELYSELAGDILLENGCEGIILSEEYYNESFCKDQKNYLKGYIPNLSSTKDALAKIQKELYQQQKALLADDVPSSDLGGWQLTYRLVNDEDWAESWKQYWHPQRIGQNIIICPSWETFEPKFKKDVIISLDPGGAFGTGTHATTKLCIEALEDLINDDVNTENVLDVGTGSGILAIVAAKLGSKNIYGIDIDPVAVKVATENAAKNDVQDICNFKEDSIRNVKEQFDILLVNILARVIISICEDLKRVTKKGGYIILSGIIASKIEDIIDPVEDNGFKIMDITKEDDWAAIIAKRI